MLQVLAPLTKKFVVDNIFLNFVALRIQMRLDISCESSVSNSQETLSLSFLENKNLLPAADMV